MCLLKILCRGCPFGKHLSMMFRNFLPRSVLTLAFHGGVVPYNFSFAISFTFWLWVIRELVSVAAHIKRFLVRRNGLVENCLAR